MRPVKLIAWLVLVAALSPSAHVFAQVCPDSYGNGAYGPTVYISGPTANYTYRDPYGTCGAGGFTFDAAAGNLYAWGIGSLDCSGSGTLHFVDDFSLLGLPSGTSAAVTVVLTWSGSGSAAIYDASGTFLTGGNFDILSPLAATQTFVGGTPTRLTFFVAGLGATGRGSVAAAFSFSNIPAGAVIVSCKGYSSDPGAATSARSSSWGQLKLLYR